VSRHRIMNIFCQNASAPVERRVEYKIAVLGSLYRCLLEPSYRQLQYAAPIWERNIVMSVSVGLSVSLCVCLSVHDHIFETTHPKFVHITYGRGSVLLRRRSDTLCTSGFMDDFIFAHKPRLLDVVAQLKRSAHAALGLDIDCAQ